MLVPLASKYTFRFSIEASRVCPSAKSQRKEHSSIKQKGYRKQLHGNVSLFSIKWRVLAVSFLYNYIKHHLLRPPPVCREARKHLLKKNSHRWMICTCISTSTLKNQWFYNYTSKSNYNCAIIFVLTRTSKQGPT